MNCKYCGKPVILVPSATERAKTFGGKPSDFTKLFPYHAHCMIEERSKQARENMKRANKRLDNVK